MIRLYRGATIPLEFTHKAFPKADWTAQLILKGVTSSQSFVAAADATYEKFTVTISASDSAAIAIGVYQIHYRYENVGGEVSFLPGCNANFLPAPTESGDLRSQNELDLIAIDSAIRAKITGGAVEEYSIQTTVGQRSAKNMSLEDLRTHRRYVLAQVDRERVQAGKPALSNNRWKKISSHLGNQSPVSRRQY
jgi:hypothetical protein